MAHQRAGPVELHLTVQQLRGHHFGPGQKQATGSSPRTA
jgi:hypothetical protein